MRVERRGKRWVRGWKGGDLRVGWRERGTSARCSGDCSEAGTAGAYLFPEVCF